MNYQMGNSKSSRSRDASNRMKPCKVQDLHRRQRVGVVAKSLKELKIKGCGKLKMSPSSVRVVMLVDGTEVEDDDYFLLIPPHSVFLLLKPGQQWNGCVEEMLDKLLDVNHHKSLLTQIRGLMQDEGSAEKFSIMTQFVSSLDMDIQSSTRVQHPDWFNGIDKRFKTKEDYMKSGAQGRVRGYLKNGKSYVQEQKNVSKKKVLVEVFDQFQTELKSNEYHGDIFVRTSESKSRLCDKEGWFSCEGPYDQSCCSFKHVINPYGSMEARILFSTWNLDHIIEKSRDILPNLVKAVQGKNSQKKLNWQYFYELLFTRNNLKLVHIACHKKEEHKSKTCDTKKFYI